MTKLVEDYWIYIAIKLLMASMGVLLFIVWNLVLIPTAILLPQLILIPWKAFVVWMYPKSYKNFIQRRGDVQSFNFYIDLTRPSHIQLFQIGMCCVILMGGFYPLISIIGGGYINSLSSFGIALIFVGAVWKSIGEPFFSAIKIKASDLLDVGDMIKVDGMNLLVMRTSNLFLTFLKLDERGEVPNGKHVLVEMPIENILEKFPWFERNGIASENMMEELHLLQGYNNMAILPTLLSKRL